VLIERSTASYSHKLPRKHPWCNCVGRLLSAPDLARCGLTAGVGEAGRRQQMGWHSCRLMRWAGHRCWRCRRWALHRGQRSAGREHGSHRSWPPTGDPRGMEGRDREVGRYHATMDVPPITYRGRIVAACTGERFCSPTTSAYRPRRSGARGRGGDMRLRYPRGLFDFVLDAGAGACASRPTHPSWPRTAIQPFSEPVRALRHVSLVSRQRTPRPQGAPALRARRSCTADSRRP
jgi:hypothetical protein